MIWQVNQVLEWVEEPGRLERIIWVRTDSRQIVTIALNLNRAVPLWQDRAMLASALTADHLRILADDPYSFLIKPEGTIPERHRQRRDASWQLIQALVEDPAQRILIRRDRGRLVADLAARSGHQKASLYKYLRRYWQGGMIKNALLPCFDRCGGRGKTRQSTERKRGRPSRLSKATGHSCGINITENVRKDLIRGAKLYYENRAGRTLREAYQLTLEKLFHCGCELQGGVLIPRLPPAETLPTFGQFVYWYELSRDPSRVLTARAGGREYALRHRPVLGDSSSLATGPGSLYQIDATIADVYLVSMLDRRRIIGRPVLYVVIDTFSRLVTGFMVMLEGPNWTGAMLAMGQAMTKKVAWCQQYGILISEADWPSHGLPEAFLADRGEMEGYQADTLVNALGIRIGNTPPFRADLKGIVERYFRTANDKVIHWIPGAVTHPRTRGERDYRLDAVLDLHQFTHLMILAVLDYNRHHRLRGYRLTRGMIQDHVEPYPCDLWEWGIRNCSGHLRSLPPETVRLNLLPQAQATVTLHGIRLHNLFYTAEVAVRQQWFVRARERGSWRISVAYDPQHCEEIYLRQDGPDRHAVCRLLRKEARVQGCTWMDILDYQSGAQQGHDEARTRTNQSTATYHAQVQKLVNEARAQTEAVVGTQSKRARLQAIRPNRVKEREYERQKGQKAAVQGDAVVADESVSPAAVTDEPNRIGRGYVALDSPYSWLREQREKIWNDDA